MELLEQLANKLYSYTQICGFQPAQDYQELEQDNVPRGAFIGLPSLLEVSNLHHPHLAPKLAFSPYYIILHFSHQIFYSHFLFMILKIICAKSGSDQTKKGATFHF